MGIAGWGCSWGFVVKGKRCTLRHKNLTPAVYTHERRLSVDLWFETHTAAQYSTGGINGERSNVASGLRRMELRLSFRPEEIAWKWRGEELRKVFDC